MDTPHDAEPTRSQIGTRPVAPAGKLDGSATASYHADKAEESLSLETIATSQAWQIVAERVEAFSKAWAGAAAPPALASFLPDTLAPIRRLALIELIKIDLEHRWRRAEWRRPLEEYAAQFPELWIDGELPVDLIYEEFHVRRQAGEAVSPEEYQRRFPRQASHLANLLKLEGPAATSQVFSTDRPESFEVGQTLEDFDLLEKLGQGAFATVFLARQRSLGRRVALKISADRGEEARTMAQLDHPCVVRVFDERRLRGRKLRLLYIEYVPGGTLQSVVERVRALPPTARSGRILLEAIDAALERAGQTPSTDSTTRQLLAELSWPEAVCWLGARLAGALDYLHREQVLHRDLKPANVLLAADGTPKLTDFNISYGSKVEGATAAAFFGGSLAYMSPEQLEAFNPAHSRQPEEIDHRSDVYALGIVLWELLTGRRPFADDIVPGQWNETLQRLTEQRRAGVTPEAIRQLPSDCPGGLEPLLLACLAPEAHERPAAAGELSRQFALCLQPEAQRLLRPRKGHWSERLRSAPVASMVTPGVLASVVASSLSIAYNRAEIVAKKPPATGEVFLKTIMVVNPVAYAVGIGVLLWLAWPVLRAVRRRHRGQKLAADAAPRWRDRCLQLGDFVAWVTAALWTVSGLVFPAWLHLELGAASQMEPRDYVHFLTVQFLLGLMAATLSFFLVTAVEVHGYYPVLVSAETDETHALRTLRALERRIAIYMVLAFSAVPLSILALVLVQAESQWWFGVLAVMGLATSGLSYWLSTVIRNDCEALVQAVRPSAGLWGRGPGESVTESFWSRSR